MHILLVDDNPGDVRLTVEALKEKGISCEVSVAVDGIEAMARLRREGEYAGAPRPDLVLLDLDLPGKNGFDVLREMRADPATRPIPVVILSLSDADEDVNRAYEMHANCYVTKPGELDEIMNVMKLLVDYWMKVAQRPAPADD